MKLHNTLTGTQDELTPISAGVVKLYTCGLTVYSQPHVGNWLGYIYWDVLVRALEGQGLKVERTQNITDVGHLTSDDDDGEDKMEKGARIEGSTAWDVATRYIDIADHEGYDILRLKRPTHLARATDYIAQQIEFAQQLEAKGYTYVIDGEGLYFDTSKLATYGKLAHLDASGLEAGKRVAVGGKKLVTDFAIWKFSPQDSKRDMEWDSPWGKGFPGWHLECSVIARETLGDEIDIHTGGIDHIPIHHTNEIAQTESVTGKSFSRVWLHNNHIKIDGTKIAKSIGNIITINDIIAHGYDIQAFKLTALSKHYRTEGNFDWDILTAAQNRLNNWRSIAALRHQIGQSTNEAQIDASDLRATILEHLGNDLDTPGALTSIEEWFSRFVASGRTTDSIRELSIALTLIDDHLGIDLMTSTPDISDEQKALIGQRQDARGAKDWQESDRIRDQLLESGISLNDTADGVVWSYSR